MNRKLVPFVVGSALAILAAAPAFAYTGQSLAKDAKITIAEASAIALKARPGKIVERELEQEDGGLRYSFIIRHASKKYEVGVDAKDGRVLENKVEGKNPD